ncbi:MAG: gliding motility-associated C-terminal domain-containing protein [Bacteroidia bacterium]
MALFLLLVLSSSSYSQAFWTENFTNNCASNCLATGFTGVNGSWSVFNTSTNGLDNNNWYVSAAEEGFSAGNCAAQNGTDDCLHISANFNTFGDQGAAYVNDGLGGTFAILTDSRAESPTINCTGQSNIVLQFDYIEGGEGTNDNTILWYFDGTTWSQLFDLPKTTLCFPQVGTWTTYQQSLPASANNNPNVKIGFSWVNNDNALGDAPSFAVDDITLTATVIDSITTQAIAAGPFCGCDVISVPFVSVGTYNAGNVYTVELSNASGSFTSPTNIGTFTSTANSGTINATIPCGASTGGNYLVRVVSSNPVVTGSTNGTAFTINAVVTPTVSITPNVSGSFCSNLATFTATVVNGGSSPSFQWQLNGVNVGIDSLGYNASTFLNNGDSISVVITSNAACASPLTANAYNLISCSIDSITIGAGVAAGAPYCGCDALTIPFTATGSYNGGNTFTAQLSNSSGSFSSPTTIGTLTSTTGNGTINATIPCGTLTGASYKVRVISSSPTIVGNATNNFSINTNVAPTASISENVTGSFCTNTGIFTASTTNGGSNPSYQWMINGANVGNDSIGYITTNTLNNGDIVSVIVTSNAQCAVPNSIQANNTITCIASTDSITTGVITAGPFCGCDSLDVPFTSSGTYTAGNVYTVQLSDASGSFTNPTNIGTLSSTANAGTIDAALPCGIASGSGYLVRVVSSSPSIIGSANGVAFTATTFTTPTATISATFNGSICTDTTTTLFTATITNGGTSPSFQWQLNGINVGTNAPTFDPDSVMDFGDIVTVILTSNASCISASVIQEDTVIVCNTLAAGTIVGSPFCGCDSVDVPFTSTGILGAGNVYTAQLSDGLGDFSNAVDIGSLVSSTNNGTISAAIPCNAIQGNSYVIRVLSSSPLDTAVAVADTLVINPVAVPIVSLSTTATTALCIDTAVTFAATPTNGGTAPTYIWERNGVVVGTNSPLYTTSGAFMMGETITITMVSNEVCALPDTVQDFMIIDCPQIEIPNVFTPNGDGINDLFRVNLSGRALEGFKIDIYDRWGILMFSSNSINYKWDGRTTSGQEVKDGTYFYVVELNGTVYKGYVMVLH